jgi:imidazolonepropionase-like amidohydrolase
VIHDSVVEIAADGTFGRISGPEGSAQIPAEARVIDVAGARLTPGLIAADSALGLVEIDLEASTRDDHRSTPRPSSGDANDVIKAAHDASLAIHEHSSLLQIQAIAGVTSAAVAPRGGLVSGQVAWIDLVFGDRDIVAKPRIALDANLGRSYGDSRAATLAKLRAALSDAELYRTRRGAYDRGQSRELAAHHLDLQALAPVLRGRAPLTITAHRASDIRAALALADEFSLKIAIVGGAEAWKEAEALARADVPVVLQPTQNLPASLDRLGARLDAAALLDRAGVRVVIAIPGTAHNVRNITQEAGVAVAYGLDWEKALSAVTVNVARVYGMDQDYGTVDTGKIANLVVWSGDPFELSTRAERVFIRGRAIPMRSRQTLLRDRYRDLSRFSAKNKK